MPRPAATHTALWCTLAVAAFAYHALAGPAPGELLVLRDDLGQAGEVLRPEASDFGAPGLSWQRQIGVGLVYERVYDDFGAHRLDFTLADGGIRGLWSDGRVPVQPNRRYTVSALIRADFDREGVEVNLGLRPFDPERNYPLNGSREAGLPARTAGPDGWERWTWSFVTPSIEELPDAALTLWAYVNDPDPGTSVEPTSTLVPLWIADFCAVEHPSASTPERTRGEGVTLRGGPGALPMSVEEVRLTERGVRVTVTGASYDFDTRTGLCTASQRVGVEREVAVFDFGDDLEGLTVLKTGEHDVVLASDTVTIGVQCDGVLLVAPHAGNDLELGATALIETPFARFARGHLFARDDRGGFTVNPLPVVGSGRLPTASVRTPAPAFAALAEDDHESVTDDEAGWGMTWTVEPGDRVALSVFPPRPFEWEESFENIWFWTFVDSPIASYDTNRPWTTAWGLWDFSHRAWAMSHSDEYTPVDEDALRAHVERIHAQGDAAFPYMSVWFHRTRDPAVFVGEVERWMREYGVDGIYSDGLPAVEWLAGYETMRMLRELVHDGPLVIHDSVPQSGRSISMFQPFLYTYATHTYMGEHLETDAGPAWAWARYALSQHGAANCFGDIKGDKWNDGDGSFLALRKDLTNLVYNGRSSPGTIGYVEEYLPALAALRENWREHGADAQDYYHQHHLPRARAITGIAVGPSAAPIIERTANGDGTDRVTLRSTGGGALYYALNTGPARPYSGPFDVASDATVVAHAREAGLDRSVSIESAPTD